MMAIPDATPDVLTAWWDGLSLDDQRAIHLEWVRTPDPLDPLTPASLRRWFLLLPPVVATALLRAWQDDEGAVGTHPSLR
ncbi:MAG: hypothetical protein EPO13_08190 [Actinomycetota bacterium]|nr:MAG: hypothetical protein EPO13_08190 [Actinomycetota bacterium]